MQSFPGHMDDNRWPNFDDPDNWSRRIFSTTRTLTTQQVNRLRQGMEGKYGKKGDVVYEPAGKRIHFRCGVVRNPKDVQEFKAHVDSLLRAAGVTATLVYPS